MLQGKQHPVLVYSVKPYEDDLAEIPKSGRPPSLKVDGDEDSRVNRPLMGRDTEMMQVGGLGCKWPVADVWVYVQTGGLDALCAGDTEMTQVGGWVESTRLQMLMNRISQSCWKLLKHS